MQNNSLYQFLECKTRRRLFRWGKCSLPAPSTSTSKQSSERHRLPAIRREVTCYQGEWSCRGRGPVGVAGYFSFLKLISFGGNMWTSTEQNVKEQRTVMLKILSGKLMYWNSSQILWTQVLHNSKTIFVTNIWSRLSLLTYILQSQKLGQFHR